jgi:hypothetical protein
MMFLEWLASLFGKGPRDPEPLKAVKCPACAFWSSDYGADALYYWLPRAIGDGIGRTKSMEEEYRHRKAYGKLWLSGRTTVNVGGDQWVGGSTGSGGYFDEFVSKHCPVCDTAYSGWQRAQVICKECQWNVELVNTKRAAISCARCGSIDHTHGVAFRPVPEDA